jgi:hypothetical protein
MQKVKLRIIEKNSPQFGKVVEYSKETAEKILQIQSRSGLICYEVVKDKKEEVKPE